jgi:hypothetical protein
VSSQPSDDLAPLDDPKVAEASIDWYRSTPWFRLLSGSLRISWRASHLIWAALGLWLTQLGWTASQTLFPLPTPSDFWQATPAEEHSGGEAARTTPWGSARTPRYAFNQISSHEKLVLDNLHGGVLFSSSTWLEPVAVPPQPPSAGWEAERLRSFVTTASPATTWYRFVEPVLQSVVPGARFTDYCRVLAGVLWTAGVWSIFGAVLARRSVIELGQQTSIGWGVSLRLAIQRWTGSMWSMGLPAVGIALIALVPWAAGGLTRLGSVGLVLGSLTLIPAVLLAVAIGWLAVLMLFGFPIGMSAVVAERRGDGFEGASRGGAYLFQAPMTLLLSVLVGSLIAPIGFGVITLVASFALGIIGTAYALGAGAANATASADLPGLSAVALLLGYLPAAFPLSFFWSWAAATYLVVRREIDGTDYDDLDLQEVGPPRELEPLSPAKSGSAPESREADAESKTASEPVDDSKQSS